MGDQAASSASASEMDGSSAFGALETSSKLTDAQIEALANEILDQLSLEEKVDMMSGGHGFFEGMLHFSSAGYKRHPVTTASIVSPNSPTKAATDTSGRKSRVCDADSSAVMGHLAERRPKATTEATLPPRIRSRPLPTSALHVWAAFGPR
jgi:hypothetical protein